MNTTFLTVLATLFFLIASIRIVATFIAFNSYKNSKLAQLEDKLKGVGRTFLLKHWPYVWIVSLAWLISRFFPKIC